MQIYCRGTAKFRQAETDTIYEIECKELDWEDVGGDERHMGFETHYEATIDHPALGLVSWNLWEYPEGVENNKETNVGKHAVIDDFDYGLEHEIPEPDDWLNYAAPENPYRIFMHSYHQTGDLLADHGRPHGNFLLNRMVFSHQVTALEAYLGDTLIKEVMGDDDALQRLLATADELVHTKLTLAEVFKSPDLVHTTVRMYLRDVLYHNLGKVNVLYKIALGFHIIELTKDKSSLYKAISLRHDCVHRNGFDKDGNELKVFTKEFVQGTADLVKEFVDNIEKSVRSR